MALGISLLSLMIAGITAYFVFRQHALEKSKFKLEAYDRRIQVYDAIKGLISTVLIEGIAEYSQLTEMLRETKHAIFLFDEEEIKNYIEQLYKKGLDLDYKERKLQDKFGSVIGDEREQLSLEVLELHRWFAAQLTVVDEKFKPYLKL